MKAAAVDPTARCDARTVGEGTRVGAFAVVEDGATLGRDVVVGRHVIVTAGATLGDRVVLGDGAFVGGLATVEDDAALGVRTVLGSAVDGAGAAVVRAGARLGDGAIVSPGAEVGARAVVSPGAVVDRSVPANAVVAGNPAAITGYVGFGEQRAMEPVRHGEVPPPGPDGDVLDSVVAGVQLHHLPEVRDLRGSLVAGELAQRLPFVVRRYFLVFDVPGSEIRGEHAHFECHQFLVAVAGELHVIADDGRSREEFVLDDRRTGLYLPPLVWGVQYQYSRECVLMVLASHEYDSTDYIRNYSDYLIEMGRRTPRAPTG